jgi:very-short-patch-repair endonuclease
MFFPSRRWKFDFFWPDDRLAVEIQGFGPGHNSRAGMKNDANKNNAAISLGYNTLYFTSYHLEPLRIKATIKYVAFILRTRRKM